MKFYHYCNKYILVLFFLSIFCCGISIAQSIDEKVKKLTLELRCMTCQNQSIHDSEAEFSNDIKKKMIYIINNRKLVKKLFFYGAGCGVDSSQDRILKVFKSIFITDFEKILPDEPGDDAKAFQVAFFATREVVRNNFWDEWLSLNRLYKGSEVFIDLINSHCFI